MSHAPLLPRRTIDLLKRRVVYRFFNAGLYFCYT